MNRNLTYLLIIIGSSILTLLLLYIDTRLFDKQRENKEYVKSIFFVDFIVLCVLYFLSWIAPVEIRNMITTPAPKIEGNTIKVPGLEEYMLTEFN